MQSLERVLQAKAEEWRQLAVAYECEDAKRVELHVSSLEYTLKKVKSNLPRMKEQERIRQAVHDCGIAVSSSTKRVRGLDSLTVEYRIEASSPRGDARISAGDWYPITHLKLDPEACELRNEWADYVCTYIAPDAFAHLKAKDFVIGKMSSADAWNHNGREFHTSKMTVWVHVFVSERHGGFILDDKPSRRIRYLLEGGSLQEKRPLHDGYVALVGPEETGSAEKACSDSGSSGVDALVLSEDT